MSIKVTIRDSLRNFRRQYREPVIRLLISLFARLPFSVLLKIGGAFGWLLWFYNGEMRKVSEKNITLCFPSMMDDEQKQLAKQSLIETGKTITEIAALWSKPKETVLSLVTHVEGEEHIHKAIDEGRAVIILPPHLGAWEMTVLFTSSLYPMTLMYRPPEMKGLESRVRAGRTRFGSTLAPTDTRGVRALFSALNKGELACILPDQDPGTAGAEFVPFFNVQASTMTLVSKLAQKTNADVIGCFAKRKKDNTGYELFFSPANKKINDTKTDVSLTAMNEEVEKLIRQCPEQYQWGYKRFKTRPDGENSFYK